MRSLILPLALLGACAAQPETPDADQALAAPAAPAAALPGSRWVRIDGPEAPEAPTLEFGADGAGGYAGCNRWFGAASIEGTALSFSAVGTTRRMCPPPHMAAERAMTGALAATRAWRIEGAELVLLDEAGAVAARFAPAPAAEPAPSE